MNLFLTILIIVSALAVLVTLGLGLFSLMRGGEFAQKHSNRLMRLRVVFQAIAIVVLLGAILIQRNMG